MKSLLVVTALILAGCSATPQATPTPTPTRIPARTLHPGDNSLTNFRGGSYEVSWDGGGCKGWESWVAPTTAGAANVRLPVTDSTGSAVIDLPAGEAYVNDVASCPPGAAWTLTLAAR